MPRRIVTDLPSIALFDRTLLFSAAETMRPGGWVCLVRRSILGSAGDRATWQELSHSDQHAD
jgi:hypothetical protein